MARRYSTDNSNTSEKQQDNSTTLTGGYANRFLLISFTNPRVFSTYIRSYSRKRMVRKSGESRTGRSSNAVTRERAKPREKQPAHTAVFKHFEGRPTTIADSTTDRSKSPRQTVSAANWRAVLAPRSKRFSSPLAGCYTYDKIFTRTKRRRCLIHREFVEKRN